MKYINLIVSICLILPCHVHALMLSFYEDIVSHAVLEELLMQGNKTLPELDFDFIDSYTKLLKKHKCLKIMRFHKCKEKSVIKETTLISSII